jgi:hypothetical protein
MAIYGGDSLNNGSTSAGTPLTAAYLVYLPGLMKNKP